MLRRWTRLNIIFGAYTFVWATLLGLTFFRRLDALSPSQRTDLEFVRALGQSLIWSPPFLIPIVALVAYSTLRLCGLLGGQPENKGDRYLLLSFVVSFCLGVAYRLITSK
jgi:hypothetical protein